MLPCYTLPAVILNPLSDAVKALKSDPHAFLPAPGSPYVRVQP